MEKEKAEHRGKNSKTLAHWPPSSVGQDSGAVIVVSGQWTSRHDPVSHEVMPTTVQPPGDGGWGHVFEFLLFFLLILGLPYFLVPHLLLCIQIL